MHLAIWVFLLSLATSCVEWIGKTVLVELAFNYFYAPTFLRSLSTRQRALKRQILENKSQLVKTSSQDEFAKWAKLRRNLDKGLKDLETLNGQLQSHHSSFASRLSLLITFVTTGTQFALAWWYRRRPVFWLPHGWVPSGVGWLLRFGGGPKGSVSVTVWAMVCTRTIKTIKEILVEWVPNPAAALLSTTTTKSKTTKETAPDSEHQKEKVLASPVRAAAGPQGVEPHAKTE